MGATAWFVRAPFLLEGALQGLGGGILSALALAALWNRAALEWIDGQHLAPRLLPLILDLSLWGMGLGLLGALIAVRRFDRL